MTTGGADLAPLAVAGRLERLRERLGDVGVDALLVTSLVNVRWLTGFTGSAGVLVVGSARVVLATDGRYRTQSADQVAAAGVADVVDIAVGGLEDQAAAIVAAVSPEGSRVGFEATQLTVSAHEQWATRLSGSTLVPTRGVVEDLRVAKDAGELARMERAASIADAALADVLPALSEAGMTERRFAAELDHAMRLRGAEEPAFETIVAAGERSAMPHARPGSDPIRPGDAVVVDFGAVYDGYRSDMTRTFCVGGEPAGELAVVFSLVAEAQAAGVAAVAPGVTAGAVDAVCRDRIASAGYGERFEHGTGHGVGLEIHEAPSVAPGSTAILTPGTVVTVEPGVYLPGAGGVRVEDTLVVTEVGARALTRFPKSVPV
ncbi:MAG: Xaa-Pro peptidase family protein [Actinomycetota bacterium]|nr:Xaa-Pro peptidase family protein [Actinomycetota bacterium]